MKKQTKLKNEKGMAVIETIPLLLLFVFLVSYTLGAFGIVHTAIMYSISARTYAFETFRNRTNLTYFRDLPESDSLHFQRVGCRFHSIASEERPPSSDDFIAPERRIRMGLPYAADDQSRKPANHDQIWQDDKNLKDGSRNTSVNADPVWVLVQYGICLDNNCGGD